MKDVILWQRVEGALVFAGSIALFIFSGSDLPWWAALALFFVLDLSFLAYPLGPRLGARVYNLVHVYALGVVLIPLGTILALPVLTGLGTLWLAHVGFDRMLGYGLKSETAFHDTHLGRIGKRA